MRIAVAQMGSVAGEFDETARRMVERSRLAAQRDVDLLIFPMTTLCGSRSVPTMDREGFLLDLAGCILSLAESLACPCVVPVLTDMGGSPVPDALLIADGEITPLGLAARLEAIAAASASGAADPVQGGGEGALPEFEFGGARLGVAFTYEDLDTYVEYEYNVDVILFLSGYGFAVDDPSSALGASLTEGRFLGDAEATGAWIVCVGSLGCYDTQVFCGSSFVLAPWGELAAQAPSLEEGLIVCDVDPSAEGPLADPLTPEVFDSPLMTWGALTMGVSDAVRRQGASGACSIVTGDLLPAVVLTLATDALGPTNVRVIVDEGDPDAMALVRALRIPQENVEPLGPAPEGASIPEGLLAEASLASLAQRTGCLPLGSSDKTARALEEPPSLSAARLHPLGDLYRSDVVALAHLRNTISPVIPAATLARFAVPAVEGLDDALSSDESRLEFVDLVLSSYVEWETPVSDIVAQRGRPELVESIAARLRELDSRRWGDVQAITISSKTLAEARGPVGLHWCDHVRPEEDRLTGKLAPAAPKAPAERAAEASSPAADRVDDGERDVRDLLGYLRDFSAGGGFTHLDEAQGPSGHAGRHGSHEGPESPFWESPFSEN